MKKPKITKRQKSITQRDEKRDFELRTKPAQDIAEERQPRGEQRFVIIAFVTLGCYSHALQQGMRFAREK